MDGMKTLLAVHLTVGRTPFKTPTKGRITWSLGRTKVLAAVLTPL